MAYHPRIPVAADYAQIIGYAVYNFTYYEWVVIWSVEKLAPGILNTHAKMPAGKILSYFKKALTKPNILPAEINLELQKAMETFERLKDKRNDLLHAHPYTAPGGEQRLGRQSIDWKKEDIEFFATEIQDASIHLNGIFHQHLK